MLPIDDIDKYARNVVQLLYESNKKVATAESCTGGLISSALTSVAGSSTVFDLGLCTYGNWAKEKLLGVPAEVIQTHGAVSHETAAYMAAGVREVSGADFGLSVTGIAGPDGGTAEKPVGTVFIACAYNGGCTVKKFNFPTQVGVDTRTSVRNSSVIQGLIMLENAIKLG